MSWAWWYKGTHNAGGGEEIASCQTSDSSPNNGWRLEDPAQPYLVIARRIIAQVGRLINDGNWHLIVFTLDALGNVRSYLDNASQASASGVSMGADSAALELGAATDLGRYCTAEIQEFLIFNVVLSSTQVGLLWNGGAGAYGIPSGFLQGSQTINNLIADFHLDGNADDYSQNANNGAWSGAAAYAAGHLTAITPVTTVNTAAVDANINSDGSGNLTISALRMTGANLSGSPANPSSPRSWLKMALNGNTYYLPLYQ